MSDRYKNRVINNLTKTKTNYSPKRNHNLHKLLSYLSRKYKFNVYKLKKFYVNLFDELKDEKVQELNKLRLDLCQKYRTSSNDIEFEYYDYQYNTLITTIHYKWNFIWENFAKSNSHFQWPKHTNYEDG